MAHCGRNPLQEETVTAVQVHTVYALRDVTIQNADGSVETIDTTDSHPFYVQGQGWVSADDLTAGETLSTPDGQTATVVGLLVFWNSNQFNRLMNFDGVVAKCSRNILPTVHPQQIQDGITDTSQYLRSRSLANAARMLAHGQVADIMQTVFNSPVSAVES